MDKLPSLLLLSAVGLFVGALAAYLVDQPIAALALLAAAIGDAAVALWLRGRGRT